MPTTGSRPLLLRIPERPRIPDREAAAERTPPEVFALPSHDLRGRRRGDIQDLSRVLEQSLRRPLPRESLFKLRLAALHVAADELDAAAETGMLKLAELLLRVACILLSHYPLQ